MAKMTSRERFACMYEHRPADRIPVIDEPWAATIERWQTEGMPKDVNWVDFFDLDHVAHVGVDNSPRYEVKVLEQTDEYKVHTSKWGVTMRDWKHAGGTPEFLHHTIVDRESWKPAKARMAVSPDRIGWDYLKQNYPIWQKRGDWISGMLWFGFDVTHSWTVGTERFLMALVDDPDWCVDMFNTCLDVAIGLYDLVLHAGYHMDEVMWYDDLGFKHNQFMSVKMYRELLKPVHKRACDWAHSHGLRTRLHSCGDVNPFVPEFIEIGIDALNPLEVKAGMDPVALKKKYGKDLVFHGGINAVLWDNLGAITGEMRKTIPAMKENGGYIFSSDHSVPNTVSLENFRAITQLAKELGSY